MKAKVIAQFYDSKAKVIRNKDQVFELTPGRFNEIRLKGRYIEAYEEPAKTETAPKK